MTNRYGRRARQHSRRPEPSSSSGTQPPDPTPSPESGAEIVAFPRSDEQIARDLEEIRTYILGPDPAANARAYMGRRNLEALGFVFPRPGEAFGELGGLGPPPDPLEEKIRRELGL